MQVIQLTNSCVFTEGPVWHPRQYLTFSDIPASKRYKWAPGEGLSTVLSETHKGNGMTYDSDLNLLVCEHVTSSVVKYVGGNGGERVVLCSTFEGKELNSPNDIVVKTDGSIWFTDPVSHTCGLVQRPLTETPTAVWSIV